MTESKSRLIVTRMEHGGKVRQFCVLEENRRIAEIRATDLETIPGTAYENRKNEKRESSEAASDPHTLKKEPHIGEVYVGQVETMPKNLEAAFVRIAPDVRCYLPLKETGHAIFASERRKLPLRPGDEILVQVTREAMGMKLASVSCRISIPGQYMVIEAGEPGISFSRKLSNQEKSRLEEITSRGDFPKSVPWIMADKPGSTKSPDKNHEIMSAEPYNTHSPAKNDEIMSAEPYKTHSPAKNDEIMSVEPCNAHSPAKNQETPDTPHKLIIRTNASVASEQELLQECEFLTAEFHRITDQGRHRALYTKLYESEPPYIDMLKGIRMDQLNEIVSDDPTVVEVLRNWTDLHAPELRSRIRRFEDPLLPLYKMIGLEGTLTEMQHRIVWLKCGGFIVIEKTEAFVSIDVNSGKFTTKKKPEEAFRQVNLEAAEEAARQIRLRNLSGIILIDFINMKNPDHDEELMNVLKKHLKKDPLKAQVVDMTALHIVEVTRKKTGPAV